MGYTSTVEGMITFDPPINWAQYREADRFRADEGGKGWLRLVLTAEPVETDEGTLERKTAGAIVSRCDQYGPLKNAEDGVAKDLRDLLALLAEDGRPRTFSGELFREGERQGDVQRFWIENGATIGPDRSDCVNVPPRVMTARAHLAWGNPEVLKS